MVLLHKLIKCRDNVFQIKNNEQSFSPGLHPREADMQKEIIIKAIWDETESRKQRA
jgi:hypothetical protein